MVRNINSFLTAGGFSHLLTTFANSLGYSSQKSIDFLLNPFCINLVTIHFSACNFAIVYLYKEIKFKPNSLGSDQARQGVRPDLDPNCVAL